MPLFFKPADAWAGDFIPFFWNGRFHLFYLKDYRDRAGHGEGTPWFHVSTANFLDFEDHGEALPRGTKEEQDLFVFTGCVIEDRGAFHIFYTGHNPHFREAGKPEQAVMHATSTDLVRWTKDPANPILFSDMTRFEPHDWRDPFVFWNENAGEWWMLLAARLRSGPHNRRGCAALAASRDLISWEIRDPFWAPHLYFTHECPDLFQTPGGWCQVYSTFSERHVTHYRLSQGLHGPWLATGDDAFDARAWYAAKTASDGERRFAFGWAATREGEKDDGAWQWGGSLVVHEIELLNNGAFAAKPPAEVLAALPRQAPAGPHPVLGRWSLSGGCCRADAAGSFASLRMGAMPDPCRLDVLAECEPGVRGAGIYLRADAALGHGYQIRLEPHQNRVVFDRWPRPGDQPFILERPVSLPPGRPVRLEAFVEGSIVVAYVNRQVALTARGYDHKGGDWGLFASEGAATFTGAIAWTGAI